MRKYLVLLALLMAFTSCERKQVSDAQVEEYLKNHPEIVEAYLDKLNSKDSEKGDPEDNLKKHHAEIYENPALPAVGNLNSKNIVVEFYDYNCGYCKHAYENITKLIKEDNVKVILIDIPVLGDLSGVKAQVSLAVHKLAPEKFFEFHNKLLHQERGKNALEVLIDFAKERGVAKNVIYTELVEPFYVQGVDGDIADLFNIAEKMGIKRADFEAELKKKTPDPIDSIFQITTAMGIDRKALEAEISKGEIAKEIEKNLSIAKDLGMNGTPAFIVDGTIIHGAEPYGTLKKALKK